MPRGRAPGPHAPGSPRRPKAPVLRHGTLLARVADPLGTAAATHPGPAGSVRSRRIPGHVPIPSQLTGLRQTMTAVSCDIHVAERARPRHGAGPGKDVYITAVAPRKSAARKRRPLRMSLPCHFYRGPRSPAASRGASPARPVRRVAPQAEGLVNQAAGHVESARRARPRPEFPCRAGRRGSPVFVLAGAMHFCGTSGCNPAAAVAQSLTHMSLEADAHVMKGYRGAKC